MISCYSFDRLQQIQSSNVVQLQSRIVVQLQSSIVVKLQSRIVAQLQSRIVAQLQSRIVVQLQSRIVVQLQSSIIVKLQSSIFVQLYYRVNNKLLSAQLQQRFVVARFYNSMLPNSGLELLLSVSNLELLTNSSLICSTLFHCLTRVWYSCFPTLAYSSVAHLQTCLVISFVCCVHNSCQPVHHTVQNRQLSIQYPIQQ